MASSQIDPTQLLNRPRRADALRNYEKLVAAAREAFTEADRSASLEDIARRAGVGIGTLYRNFPTRGDLVEAVYVDEVQALCRSAEELSDAPPWEALESWIQRFVTYVATKQALAEELFAIGGYDAPVFQGCRTALYGAGETLLSRAREAGVVRPDLVIEDLIRLVGGIAKAPVSEPADTQRILAIALDGMRYRAG
jgi:AcrR family transcriptional regulator